MPTSRAAVAAAVGGLYLLNWPALVGGATLGYVIDRSHGERLEWDGLGGIIYGGFGGVIVLHIAWAAATWRMLRGVLRPTVVAGIVMLVPLLVIVTLAAMATAGIGAGALTTVTVFASAIYPAGATWWATDPDH